LTLILNDGIIKEKGDCMTINTLAYGNIQVTEEYHFSDDQNIETIEMDDGSYYRVYEYDNLFFAFKLEE
jgi:hypothetical protein